jgi:pyruvate/2-oxoglutarate dehydrogenase complex dihydrolipoamide acyltransferase (E2) component
MIEILVPRENVNDDSVIIRAIHVNSGEFAKKGQTVVEIETSKTNIEIDSPGNGLISHNLEVGTEISVGALLFWIGGDDADTPDKSIENNQLEKFDFKISKAALK